jgi:hypothetical protein
MPNASPEISSVSDALAALGRKGISTPRHPVLRGPAGTLLSVAIFDPQGKVSWHGAWVTSHGIEFLNPVDDEPGSLIAPGASSGGVPLPEPTRRLAALLGRALLSYLEQLENLDARMSTLQAEERKTPISEVGALQRSAALVNEQLARVLSMIAELSGALGSGFPELEDVLPSLEVEADRLQQLSTSLSQTFRDVVLLRSAEEANRIAEAANELGRISNRIASLQNTSNIRMLGIAYLAFVIALISVVVLIPNTAATILGMPSAAWVPGLWVDVILVVLAVIPIVVVFSRSWVLRVMRDLRGSEARATEGIEDLPELPSSGPKA